MTDAAGDDLKSLLGRAEDYAARDDIRSAVAFYQEAIRLARGGLSDPSLLPALHRGQQFVQQAAGAFRGALEQAVENNRPEEGLGRLRVDHALDMLKGERQVYQQQPAVFYYPYLAQRQYFERDEFDWVPEMEAATPAIRDELLALIEGDADFQPYVQDDPDRPRREFHGLHDDSSWTALYLWKDGKVVEANAERCPRTMAALAKVPLSRIGSRTPAVLFSRLEAGAHIPPHSGMLNCRLICHLPLIVPPGCWFRVGNETRHWEEGKLLIFDDSFEHEAKNPTGDLRIILLFDVWRPEISAGEQAAISAVFTAIDRFQGIPEA